MAAGVDDRRVVHEDDRRRGQTDRRIGVERGDERLDGAGVTERTERLCGPRPDRVFLVRQGGEQRLEGDGGDPGEPGGRILDRPRRPLAVPAPGGGDRLGPLRLAGLVPGPQHVAVIVRHHRLARGARADFLAADDQRDIELLARELGQARLERAPLRGPGGV